VDPLGTLQRVYFLLDRNGVAIIRHFPLDALIPLQRYPQSNVSVLQKLLDATGYKTYIYGMLDSPGNYGLIMKKEEASPSEFLLPLEYTGTLCNVGGYSYAGAQFIHQNFSFEIEEKYQPGRFAIFAISLSASADFV